MSNLQGDSNYACVYPGEYENGLYPFLPLIQESWEKLKVIKAGIGLYRQSRKVRIEYNWLSLGGEGRAPPAQNFISIQFSGKLGQIIGLVSTPPPQEILDPTNQQGAVTRGWNVSLYSIQDTPPCCPYMVSINKTREYSSK